MNKHVFDNVTPVLKRVAPKHLESISKTRGSKVKECELVILGFGGRRYNNGVLQFIAPAKRVSLDTGFSLRTVERAISNLKQNGLLNVIEQGYGIRTNGTRKVFKSAPSIYSLTEKAIKFLNEISNNFFSGIKKLLKSTYEESRRLFTENLKKIHDKEIEDRIKEKEQREQQRLLDIIRRQEEEGFFDETIEIPF